MNHFRPVDPFEEPIESPKVSKKDTYMIDDARPLFEDLTNREDEEPMDSVNAGLEDAVFKKPAVRRISRPRGGKRGGRGRGRGRGRGAAGKPRGTSM